jgi:outer membrane receptor protein involved in Fe transport
MDTKTSTKTLRGLTGLVSLTVALVSQAAEYQGIEEVVVTAEKRTSTVQDTAIAVSAFDAEALESRQIATTSELQFSVPNMMFGKSNFEGSSISIRGVGNLAVADSSDNGVGIHVNDIYLNEPRIFETEFYDVERMEILRGPQGTLYGRNTTGGVMNMITAKPKDVFEADLSVGFGDYSERKVTGMVNVPLSDTVATRLAGYYLKRDGYTDNLYTGNDIDDRDLYSVRWTTDFQFGENTEVTFMASYMDEDDARSRTTKQLCTKDPRGAFGTGCLPGSKGFSNPHSQTYITSALADLATANSNFAAAMGGPARPALSPNAGVMGGGYWSWIAALEPMVAAEMGQEVADLYTNLAFSGEPTDFFEGTLNPASLREVYSDFDPEYTTDETILSLEIRHDFENITLKSMSAYHEGNTEALTDFDWAVPTQNYPQPVTYNMNGTDRVATFSEGIDRAQAETEQWSEQITLFSNNDGKLNWTAGAFYLHFEKDSHYNVFSSGLGAWSDAGGMGSIFETILQAFGLAPPELNSFAPALPRDLAQFDSYTQYEVDTWALFGELYYDFSDDTRITLGLRYSDETKEVHARTYFVDLVAGLNDPLSDQNDDWQEVTGKLSIDHNLDLSFTDETLVFATVARGYKGGGFNPPQDDEGFPDTFDPEYINSLELGVKSRLMDNRVQANIALFFYDYEGLQVSQIVNQTAINENVDAEIQGLEAEFMFAPNENWLFSFNLAYLDAEVKDFATVDTANPTGENPVVNVFGDLYPFPSFDRSEFEIKDLSGNDLVATPEMSINFFAEYYRPLSNGMSLIVHADYYYQDEFYARNFNTAADEIPSWDVSNAFVSLTSADEQWTVKAWVKNIQDDDNITGFYTSDGNTGLFSNVFVMEPRTYGLTFSMNFR